MAKQMTVRNLRRFAKQWAEYEDETQELLEFDEDDARYVSEVLFVGSSPMDKYRDMANLMPEVYGQVQRNEM
jgi:hypothetical protein